MLSCSSTFLQTINLLIMYQLLWSFINLYKDNGCLVFLPPWLFKKANIIDYAILVSIYLCCKFCPMFGWRKIDRHCCFHCFYYCKAFFTWCVFLLKVSRLEKKKRLQLPQTCFSAGTETSLGMKEVSFWAVKEITRNDSAREERNEISVKTD